jgi:hypothetical protein
MPPPPNLTPQILSRAMIMNAAARPMRAGANTAVATYAQDA